MSDSGRLAYDYGRCAILRSGHDHSGGYCVHDDGGQYHNCGGHVPDHGERARDYGGSARKFWAHYDYGGVTTLHTNVVGTVIDTAGVLINYEGTITMLE